jgi:hypothetical protein
MNNGDLIKKMSGRIDYSSDVKVATLTPDVYMNYLQSYPDGTCIGHHQISNYNELIDSFEEYFKLFNAGKVSDKPIRDVFINNRFLREQYLFVVFDEIKNNKLDNKTKEIIKFVVLNCSIDELSYFNSFKTNREVAFYCNSLLLELYKYLDMTEAPPLVKVMTTIERQ